LDLITVRGAALNSMVEVFDVTGKRVLEGRLATGVVNVGSLVPGVYQLVVREGVAVKQMRFTKQ
jgi:hypothetical protein